MSMMIEQRVILPFQEHCDNKLTDKSDFLSHPRPTILRIRSGGPGIGKSNLENSAGETNYGRNHDGQHV